MATRNAVGSICRFEQELLIEGIPADLVASLQTSETVYEPCEHDPRASRIKKVEIPLLQDGCPQLGLALPLAVLAGRAGIQVDAFSMKRVIEPPVLETSRGPSRNHHVLEFVRSQPGGIINLGPGVDSASIAAEIVGAFANTLIAFVSGSIPQGTAFAARLSRLLGVKIEFVDGRPSADEEDHRVVVTTFSGLSRVYPEHEKRQLVIAIDAHEAAGEVGQFALWRCHGANLFAFHDLGEHVPPPTKDVLIRTFGFSREFVPKPGHRLRHVMTSFQSLRGATCAAVERPRGTVGDDAIYAWAIKKNPVRTRVIAKFAKQIIAAPEQFDIRRTPANEAAVAPLRVVLVAADPGHAARFGEHLKSWSFSFGGADAFAHPAVKESLRKRPRTPPMFDTKLITTPAGLALMSPAWIDVVIWAVGDQHGPALSPLKLSQPLADDRPLYLFDFRDNHHGLTRAWSRRRRLNYLRYEWFPQGITSAVGRVHSYLAQKKRDARRYANR